MFWRRAYKEDAAQQALLAENTDLRAALRQERAQHAEQLRLLLDRILALTAPGGLREVKREPLATTRQESAGAVTTPRSINYPGANPRPRRPFPPTPPQVPGTSTLTPIQAEALAETLKDPA